MIAAAHHAAQHGAPWPLLLLVAFIALAAWAASLYFHPFGQCSRCHGSRVNRGSTSKAWGRCRKCLGTGRQQRFGSRAVHRLAADVMGDGLRERRKNRLKKLGDRIEHPEDLEL